MRFRRSGTNWEGRKWSTSASLNALMNEIEAAFPKAHGSDGTVASKAHDKVSPSSDHRPYPYTGSGVVNAVDAGEVVENDASKIAEAIRSSKDSRVKYVIHEARMFSSYATDTRKAWAWGTYPLSAHADHVHVSVLRSTQNDGSAWDLGLGGTTPTPTPTPPPSGGITLTITRTQISEGSKGSFGGDVAICQGLLYAWGYGSTVGAVDGIFGDKTDTAVRAFQKAKALSQDGIVGPNTWKALES